MPHLFEPLKLRNITLRNRIAVSPMCEYSSEDGFANDWHLVHLGSRAVGGAALVFTEATAVTADGRISPRDLGIWMDAHIGPLARIVRFVHDRGAVAGMQLAHAGRKASTQAPWEGQSALMVEQGGWRPVFAPSAIPFNEKYAMPEELSRDGIKTIVDSFARSAARALAAGFDVLEIHAAHGYLLHEFLSPLSNKRADEYGGEISNRIRIICEVVEAIRRTCPEGMPLFVRISATDWVPDGWQIEDSVFLARRLRECGADLIDCSSGGNVPVAQIPSGPGYQTAFAERVRREAGIATGAVGMITSPAQADHVIRTGQAEIVLLAREMLRDPYWPLRAARELGQPASWPVQYLRAGPHGSPVREVFVPPTSKK
jgi:2,4-dienoyl-CoA reductase-like NADH-dependent reductase (Old Yellow Enzyme family)